METAYYEIKGGAGNSTDALLLLKEASLSF